VPMVGITIAFKNYRPINGIWGSTWVGFDNFTRFFKSYQFQRVLTNTLGLSFYLLIAGFPIPIILALALNATLFKKFKRTVQFVTYMPHFISTVVMVGIVLQFFNPHIGIFSRVLQAIGVSTINLLGSPNVFKSLYVWSDVWQAAGWNSIIYLASLSGVDTELHEAALMDGATRFKRILRIDLPCIMPTITTMLLLNLGKIMNLGFEKVFLMQNPLNLRSSEIISTYVYQVALGSGMGDFSYATAIGMFNSVVNFLLVLIVNEIAKRVGETSLW
ncbi:MAG: ABC transporter permease subunit, partial [Bacteroidales bacterium]|nr:ABC transporter permease subunit [Bacteroidales bacterium]